MPLGSGIEGQSKRLLIAVGTLLMLFDRKSLFSKMYVFFRILIKYSLKTDATDIKKPGHLPGRSLVSDKNFIYLCSS